MIESVYVTSWMLGLFLVFVGCGLSLLSLLRIKPSSTGESFFFAFVLGEGLVGYIIFLLASGQMLSAVWIWSALFVLSIVAIVGWRAWLPTINLKSYSFNFSLVNISAFLVLFAILISALILSLTPETGRDALLYHLAAPKLYLEHGGFYLIPGNLFSQYPFHTEMLYTLGLFLQGDVLAKGINFLFLLAFPLGFRAFANLYSKSKTSWILAAIIFLTLPTVFDTGHTAYSDLSTALHVFAAVLAFLNWQKKDKTCWLVLSGVCAGLALACKYTVLILPFIAFFALLVHLNKSETGNERQMMRNIFLFTGSFLLTGAPYYLKNWIITGNPFYPYLFGLFGGVGLDSKISFMLEGMTMYAGMGRGPLDYLMLPVNLSFFAGWDLFRFDGVIGPVFLLTLPFLLFLRPLPSSIRNSLLFSAVFFLFWASGSQQMRYLIPVFPFLALSTSHVVVSMKERRFLQYLLVLVVAGCVVSNVFEISRSFERLKPFGFLSGVESRDQYLTRNLLSYPMFKHVNEELPHDSRVFLIHMRSWTFFCERDCYSDSIVEVYTLQKILDSSKTADEVLRSLKSQGFTHLMYNDLFLLGDRSLLTKDQKKLFEEMRDNLLHLEKKMKFYRLYSL